MRKKIKAKSKKIKQEELSFEKITSQIWKDLRNALEKIDSKKTEKLMDYILRMSRIFVTGQGRSGLVVKAFAMRLMQLDLEAYVVDETTTPAIRPGDLLIALSSSGETPEVYDDVVRAKNAKAFTALITSKDDSKIENEVHLSVNILKKEKTKTKHKKPKIEPLGTLFEELSLIYLDSIIIKLMGKLDKHAEDLKKLHANL